MLSISIVVYNTDFDVLKNVLENIKVSLVRFRQKFNKGLHLYIVDNTCNAAHFNRLVSFCSENLKDTGDIELEVIRSPKNAGYGYGHNQALARTETKYTLVLNPDVYVYPDTMVKAIDYLEQHQNVGLLVPDVLAEDGTRNYLCKRNPTLFDMYLRSFAPSFIKKIFKKRMLSFEMRDCDYEKIISPIYYPTGCFMFFRTQILKKIGGFDERFFMYLEDADIGRRTLSISNVVYNPDIKIIHKWARGTHNSMRLRFVTVQSALKYWFKWGGTF